MLVGHGRKRERESERARERESERARAREREREMERDTHIYIYTHLYVYACIYIHKTYIHPWALLRGAETRRQNETLLEGEPRRQGQSSQHQPLVPQKKQASRGLPFQSDLLMSP